MASGQNYEGATASVTVRAEFIPKNLNDASWELISKLAKSGTLQNYYELGDTKTYSGFDVVQIIGFNHDTVADSSSYGRSKAGVTFQYGDINDSYKNVYISTSPYLIIDEREGVIWSECTMRTTILPTIKNGLPQALRERIVTIKKSTNKRSYSIEQTNDDLFLLSAVEFNNLQENPYGAEGKQYAIYSNGGTLVRRNDGGYPNHWSRTPHCLQEEYYIAFSGVDGKIDPTNASNGITIAFAFCL